MSGKDSYELLDRHAAQAEGKHPAPCARHCEANAYEFEILRLKREVANLREAATTTNSEPISSKLGQDTMTEWQSWVLSLTDKGAGVSAAPGDLTALQRKECDALVAAGLLRKTTNHSQDIYGMYVKDE